MYMKTSVMLFIFAIFLASNCKKENDEKAGFPSSSIDIAYSDALHHDLLNDNNPEHFDNKIIKVFNLINHEAKEVFYPNLDNPRNFYIYRDESVDKYFLRLFVETDTTLLQLTPSLTDTIIGSRENSNKNLIFTKLWYNGILVWEYPDEPKTEVIK